MMDPNTYPLQVLAAATAWTVLGLWARQHIAAADARRRRQRMAAKR